MIQATFVTSDNRLFFLFLGNSVIMINLLTEQVITISYLTCLITINNVIRAREERK